MGGRVFKIAGVCFAANLNRVHLIISCTGAVFDYLVNTWEFLLTGSADLSFIENDKIMENLILTGVAVYEPMGNNTQGKTITLIKYD